MSGEIYECCALLLAWGSQIGFNIFPVLLCYVILCYVMLCYVMLCHVMLFYVMLCYGYVNHWNANILIKNVVKNWLVCKNTITVLSGPQENRYTVITGMASSVGDSLTQFVCPYRIALYNISLVFFLLYKMLDHAFTFSSDNLSFL